MPKFEVYGKVTGSKYLGVFEAHSEEEAIQLALQSTASMVSFCRQCTDNCEDPEINEAVADRIE